MTKKRKTHHASSHSQTHSSQSLEHKILENLVHLQKIHTDLAEKFDRLAKEISQLLKLFELAAQSITKNPSLQVTEKDKELVEKIDKLIEQNKLIAKGLTIMQEAIYPETTHETTQQPTTEYQPSEYQEPKALPQNTSRPLPKF